MVLFFLFCLKKESSDGRPMALVAIGNVKALVKVSNTIIHFHSYSLMAIKIMLERNNAREKSRNCVVLVDDIYY